MKISDISDIGTHQHNIGDRQSFEGKIDKKSAIYRSQTDISTLRDTRAWDFFCFDLSPIYSIYRR